MKKLRGNLTYANVVATLALVIAVAGGSTAIAVTVNASKNSDVNKKGNIRAGHVTTAKLAAAAVIASKLGAIEVVRSTRPNNAEADCPGGEQLLAGGAIGGGGPVGSSYPLGNGWFVESTGTPTAFALCLKG
jgi:hypothetical protein